MRPFGFSARDGGLKKPPVCVLDSLALFANAPGKAYKVTVGLGVSWDVFSS
jgi:hypothetical protein